MWAEHQAGNQGVCVLAGGCWCFSLPGFFEEVILTAMQKRSSCSPNSMSHLSLSFFFIAFVVPFNKKKWCSLVSNMYLEIYFSFDAKQWLLPYESQFMNDGNRFFAFICSYHLSVMKCSQPSGLGMKYSSSADVRASVATSSAGLCRKHLVRSMAKLVRPNSSTTALQFFQHNTLGVTWLLPLHVKTSPCCNHEKIAVWLKAAVACSSASSACVAQCNMAFPSFSGK